MKGLLWTSFEVVLVIIGVIFLVRHSFEVSDTHKKLNECNKQLNVITEKIQGKENNEK